MSATASTTGPSRPILLDCDLAMGAPGSDIDDGFALALALGDPELDLLAVTTVGGNTDVDTATVLTLELLHRLGRPEVPVHRGSADPLVGRAAKQGSVPDGIERRRPTGEDAATLLAETVLARPGEITVVAVGPLTNVARALQHSPEVGPSMAGLMIMGGWFGVGPDGPVTDGSVDPSVGPEFNIHSDPEAATVVIDSGVPQWWVGLDVTNRCRLDRSTAERMAGGVDGFTAFAGRYTAAWIDHLAEGNPGQDWCAMHDPLAVVALSRPELITWRRAGLEVVIDGPDRGLTRPSERPDSEIRIAVDVDPEGFAARFSRLVASADRTS